MPANNTNKKFDACLCGNDNFVDCCGRFLEDRQHAQTALELMRSRYTAYALRDERYLRATWHASTRPIHRLFAYDDPIQWLSLEVRAHEQEGHAASVEFVARYKVQGRAHKLHEISRFVWEEGQWLYLDGNFPKDARAKPRA